MSECRQPTSCGWTFAKRSHLGLLKEFGRSSRENEFLIVVSKLPWLIQDYQPSVELECQEVPVSNLALDDDLWN